MVHKNPLKFGFVFFIKVKLVLYYVPKYFQANIYPKVIQSASMGYLSLVLLFGLALALPNLKQVNS